MKFITVKVHTHYLLIALFLFALIATYLSYDKNTQESVLEKSAKVLNALEQADYHKLAALAEGRTGIQFLPYIYNLGEVQFNQFGQSEISTLIEQETVYNWGTYDGNGASIELTPMDYHNAFVYDFTYADDTVARLIKPDDNILLSELHAVGQHFFGASFVLYKHNGSPSTGYNDWKALLLVFQAFEGEWFLIGIGHGEKTL